MRRYLIVFLFGLILPLNAWAQGVRFDSGACNPRWCDESGWLFDDNSSDHTTSWRHNLGVVPRSVEVLFTTDPGQRRVAAVNWSWRHDLSGNPVSIEMSRRAVFLHISKNSPLHGVWRPEGGWQRHSEGYWKIIVYK